MYSFSKKYKVGFGYGYQLEYVHSRGRDIDDLLSNAEVSVLDSEYCETDKYTELTDLPLEIQQQVERDFAEHIADDSRPSDNQELLRIYGKGEL